MAAVVLTRFLLERNEEMNAHHCTTSSSVVPSKAKGLSLSLFLPQKKKKPAVRLKPFQRSKVSLEVQHHRSKLADHLPLISQRTPCDPRSLK